MDAPFEVRLARALARDGERERANLLRWSEAESAHFAREATRAAADVHLAAPDEMSPSL
jgi:hypothetical protein